MSAGAAVPKSTEGAWRCSWCGHHRNLSAAAEAIAFGRLAENGRELEQHDDVTETHLCESSIQCDVHPDAPLERMVGGAWCRWARCVPCDGVGTVSQVFRDGRWLYVGSRSQTKCPDCKGERGAWLSPEAAS